MFTRTPAHSPARPALRRAPLLFRGGVDTQALLGGGGSAKGIVGACLFALERETGYWLSGQHAPVFARILVSRVTLASTVNTPRPRKPPVPRTALYSIIHAGTRAADKLRFICGWHSAV